MTTTPLREQDTGDAQRIADELSALRVTLEDAVAEGDAAKATEARENLLVTLVSFSSPDFDLEARFHVARLGVIEERTKPSAIAALLVAGDFATAINDIAIAVEESLGLDPRLLRLGWSVVARLGSTSPEMPWLTTLVGRIPTSAERGATAAHLIRVLPAGSQTSAELADAVCECVSSLWPETPDLARSVLMMTCEMLVDANDQALLATTVDAFRRSLPSGNRAIRNSLDLLLITSLLDVGDIVGSIAAMRRSLGALPGGSWSDAGSFSLLTDIASNAARAAETANTAGDSRVAAEAVAVANQAFGLIEQINAADTGETEAEVRDTERKLSGAFSAVAAVACSLTKDDHRLEIATREPLPLWRFRDTIDTGVAPLTPNKSARISEARFLEECARVDWKAIPTPQEVDFGLDYRVEIPETPDRTSADVEFLVQLKSTSASSNASGLLTVSIDEKTLKYWKSKVLPTLVVLFHHPTDRFYTSWYLPALDNAKQRTFRFALEDEWDPITLRNDVLGYFRHVRSSLASGGDWSVLSVMQFHCALLIKLLLWHHDLRQAALDPSSDLSDASVENECLVLLDMHHRSLTAPSPILSELPRANEIMELVRTLDAIVRSWTLAGPQRHPDVRVALVATHRVLLSARDLLHVAVELDCALASVIVEAQEARSAALAAGAMTDEPTD
jgi:hypothetical protein